MEDTEKLMECENPFAFLRQEIKNDFQRYRTLCTQKIILASSFLGLGSTIKFPNGLSAEILLFIAPFVALAYDFYIVSADYRVKRAGNFIRVQNISFDDSKMRMEVKNNLKTLKCWEEYVRETDNKVACGGFLPTTIGICLVALLAVVWQLNINDMTQERVIVDALGGQIVNLLYQITTLEWFLMGSMIIIVSIVIILDCWLRYEFFQGRKRLKEKDDRLKELDKKNNCNCFIEKEKTNTIAEAKKADDISTSQIVDFLIKIVTFGCLMTKMITALLPEKKKKINIFMRKLD